MEVGQCCVNDVKGYCVNDVNDVKRFFYTLIILY